MYRVLVRPPGDSYPDALTALDPPPRVDLALARAQHAGFIAALRVCGVDVTVLPPDHARPDAVFVQDPMLVIGGSAIVARPAAPSRAGEAGALLAALPEELQVAHLQAPATLDGGDVLVTPDRIFVGLSARTNHAACDQLAALSGLPVLPITVPEGVLHLLSGCTWLGGRTLLVATEMAGALPGFDERVVPPAESYAANCLVIGSNVIVPAGFPIVAAMLEAEGFTVYPVPMTELEKRDGGVTCLALMLDGGPAASPGLAAR